MSGVVSKTKILIIFLCLTFFFSWGKKDPRSEENLKKRAEDYWKYLNFLKFDKALNLWCKEIRPSTREQRKDLIDSWRRERFSVGIIKCKVESVRIKGDKGYVFEECRDETIFGKVRSKSRSMSIWVFEDNNWFVKKGIPIGNNICVEPIIVYNIFIEEVTPESFTLSWETDEEAECEVEYTYEIQWGTFSIDRVRVKEFIHNPIKSKKHRIILKRIGRKDYAEIRIWARNGSRVCHSFEYGVDLEEILSSKDLPKKLE